MEAKLLAVFSVGVEALNVSAVCRELGISRQTFYKYRRRWEREGPPGLLERSRRPHCSPQLMHSSLEDEIVRLRKELPLENGAQTIAYHLERSGWPVPSVSSIHRALVRRGLVTPQPSKRPHSAVKRFVWPHPNDAWQIDATEWALADGTKVWIMDLLDDHSRVMLANRACWGPTGEAAWAAFCDAVERWGLPAHVISDNGLCFTGRLHGTEVEFEQNLRLLGIRHIPSTPRHPQTCGKLERAHQTEKRWLRRQPSAATLEALQGQLDTFRDFYNHERPHRALGGRTPIEAWSATEPAAPGCPIQPQPRASFSTVTKEGHLGWKRYLIGVGRHLAGYQLLIIARDHDLTIWGPEGLVRRLTIDTNRRYQPQDV